MLLELNVKDIALIKQAEVSFDRGLNIMTGETGAGKSVIIGSALMCLGGKVKGEVIREGAESAYIELVFSVDSQEKKEKLQAMGIDIPEDDVLIMSRKLSRQRSVSRINGEAVSLSELRDAASVLIDIYGQNEYHTLLDTKKHLEILDAYMGKAAAMQRNEVASAYREYVSAKKKCESFTLDEQAREREVSSCEYEIEEIDRAQLREGEEEELAAFYKKLNNSKTILETLGRAYSIVSEIRMQDAISAASSAMHYDEGLKDIYSELLDAQSILSDAENEISSYVSSLELSEEALNETEMRLDLIRSLENKYGRTYEDIMEYRERRNERLSELISYEERKLESEKELAASEKKLRGLSEILSGIRRTAAVKLCNEIKNEMLELGFESVRVELSFTEKEPSADGMDAVSFMVSLNPGEPMGPISHVASGGELSRLMLSIKTVLAGTDDIPTLIFDEIDTGISGRTAQKVAEKLDIISRSHQVICITHLPQIASMADTHFLIEKNEEEGRNVTRIRKLSGDESVSELARLLGGAMITKAVYGNALEMKEMAENIKKGHLNGS
ncbi:MAG: DNA repair protein RecN [Lachnospiraceae bacterium]|nr:DNA repair protein RecN [Lachnospiraceae bacterium]